MTLHVPLWAVAVGLSALILWQIVKPVRELDAFGWPSFPPERILWMIPLLAVWLVYEIIT